MLGKNIKKLEIKGLDLDCQYLLIYNVFSRTNILSCNFDISSIREFIHTVINDFRFKLDIKNKITSDNNLMLKIRNLGLFCKEIIKIKPVDLSWDLHDDNILVDEKDNWIINDPFNS